MVNFCMATGISPSEYKKLTLSEYAAFVDYVERSNNGG